MTSDQNQQKNLDQQLEDLRSGLLNAQDKLKKAETGIKAGEEQIKTIEVLINKFNQIVEDYRDAYPDLLARQREFEQAYHDEKKCLENILCGDKDGLKKVSCIVHKERTDITKLERTIQDFNDKLDGDYSEEKCKDKYPDTYKEKCEWDDGLRKELDIKKNNMEMVKKKYGLWIDPVKAIESKFKNLEAIKKEIDKEHTAGNHAYAYYLLLVSDKSFCRYMFFPPYLDKIPFSNKLYKVRCEDKSEEMPNCRESDESLLHQIPYVIDPEVFEEELKNVWYEYFQADECYNDKVGELQSIERKLETAKAQLAEDQKNLEVVIKRRLTNLADEDYREQDCPPPPDTSEEKDKCS